MESLPRQVDVYVDPSGIAPFEQWLARLRDLKAKAAIDTRMARLRRGLLGDFKSVGEGVRELRIDSGPGYRVYLADDGESILLLCGGSKKTQRADVAAAKKYWKAYQEEQ